MTKVTCHHHTIHAAPETAVVVHIMDTCTFLDVQIGAVENTVFRNSPAELRAWLEGFRGKIDAAVLQLSEPVPQQTSSHDAADAAGGAPPPADAAGSADTQTEALP